MKRIFGIFALLIASLSFASAQDKKDITTEKIKVSGTCGQCKKRIENAAYISGVKRAEWDKGTKELTVTYRPSKTTLHQIEEHIAKAGHDAGEVKATEADYSNLPQCCAYKEEAAAEH
ncbi:heavy-metal-associated domain-containing protein [Taibaiella koreensis]|uniref:heavy-metal-associated domain-containing protein n=1 Tax=Taibaiella koreensis TaxID=1268548 RepID=UPI000E59E7BD|nr:cation transporter [Taibaiella koreensis]